MATHEIRDVSGRLIRRWNDTCEAAVTDAVYRERAALVAHLASMLPAVLVHGADASEPEWPVCFVRLPTGQVSWHIAPADLDLFDHVPAVHASSPAAPKWDGHSTDEKYQRLAKHASRRKR